jgi:hypothetical protein
MRIRKLLFVFVVAALCVAAMAGGVASAHVVKYPTGSLSVEYSNLDDPDSTDFFSGKVSANKQACKENRRVAVFHDTPGVDQEVGSDRTTGDGSWKVFAENAATGDYYAESDRKTLKLTVDHRHVCRAVRSQTIQAGP